MVTILSRTTIALWNITGDILRLFGA